MATNRYTDEDLAEFKALIDAKLAEAKIDLKLLQDSARQEKFVKNLENALRRIENKSFGVCRVTGKLIQKARLRLVPHATLSIEAKNAQG